MKGLKCTYQDRSIDSNGSSGNLFQGQGESDYITNKWVDSLYDTTPFDIIVDGLIHCKIQ